MFIIAFVVVGSLIVYHFIAGYRSVQKPVNSQNSRTHCSVCGTASVIWQGQFCSPECEARLAKSMDELHDHFEEME